MSDEYEYDRYLPSKITTFRQLLEHVMYSLDDGVKIIKSKDWRKDNELGYYFNINKLYILPNRVEYKTETYELDPYIFNKFALFVKLVEGYEEHE